MRTPPDDTGPTATILTRVTDRSAAGIAATVGHLISVGELPAGEQLPTVRVLAKQLGVSPATVSQAWQHLLRAGLVLTAGRRGTVVRQPAPLSGPTRFGRLHPSDVASMLDLSESVPDPALLPDVQAALAGLSRDHRQSSYFDAPIVPELEDRLRQDWPFEPAILTMVNGALDALDRVLSTCIRPGSRVIVENPTFPPILDLCELLGANVLGLSVDDRGMLPAALHAALAERDADLVLLQPRGQNPSGHSMDADRVDELAEILRGSAAIVVEDDHSAGVCTADAVSVGTRLPDRTVHIRGFSKSHGPDLRLAAIGGSERPLIDMQRRRLLGPGWSSRLLQDLLVMLLRDDESRSVVAHARTEYARRRSALRSELSRRGVEALGRDGSNLWVPVRSEHDALLHLGLHGIAVAPGSAFVTAPLASGYLRVACAPLTPDDPASIEQLADLIAGAARVGRRRR